MTAPVFTVHPGGGDNPEPPEETEQHRGQLRLAERFVREHANRMLHVHGIGWHEYDATRWTECKDGGEVRAGKDTVDTALDDLRALETDARKLLIQDIGKVESHAGMQGMLAFAGTFRPCTLAAEHLDADPHLLNTGTGTVDLRLGVERPANPSDHLSKVTRAKFNHDAHDATFDAFLKQAQPDPETRAFIARSLGSALLGKVREQVLLIWFGLGANGKGTLRDAVLHSLGDYAIETRSELLIAQKHHGSIDDIGKLRLKGTRVAFCSEISEGARMDEAVMKN